ncbi:ATP-grasp domain-containing protein [Phenylobacterium sp. LjRoot225]|uniref:ATP-grasp domain-containing protein n=1 Tax=Phenylobacterium sp. LjRoot225 TaxID=3342285 RepID=UPI003ECF311B
MRNVLIFPGGTEPGLEIARALKGCKEVRLFAASSGPGNHAPFVFARHAATPDVFTEGWLEALNALCAAWSIDLVYPAHDYVAEALVRERERISVPVIAAPAEVFAITASKRATLSLFADVIPTPAILDPATVASFPVFIKPDHGYGGQGAVRVDSAVQLGGALEQTSDPLTLEYLPGREYTIDCFSDREQGVLFAGGRTRERIRMGTAMRSASAGPERDALFLKHARAIQARLPMRGAWFFQMREDAAGTPKLLEIGTRVAGTMAFNRVRGVNFPLLSILEDERAPLALLLNDPPEAIDRALTNRFAHRIGYRRVYVDLDDTLLLHDKINVEVAAFLFRALNEGCELVLLTKCLTDPHQVLAARRLSGLFDRIVHLAEADSKADHIDPDGSIFIDDSFSQRREVAERHGIPTFDPSMLEMLMNDRID